MTTSPTTDIQPELLPCPFCGGKAVINDEPRHTKIQIICSKDFECVIGTDWREPGEARVAWNTRLTSTTPTLGDMGRVRALVEQVASGRFDELEAVADRWLASAGIQRMSNAICSVFEKYAPQDVMDRFRENVAATMHLSFVEGAAQGVMQFAPASPIPTSVANEGEPLLAREIAAQFYDKRDPLDQSFRDVAHNIRRGRLDDQDAVELVRFTLAHAALSPALDITAVEGRALADVAAERARQVEKLGWTAEHDDGHDADSALPRAAACYAVCTGEWAPALRDDLGAVWPHRWEWKPKDSRTNLVRAAALLIAEIERFDRAALAVQTEKA